MQSRVLFEKVFKVRVEMDHRQVERVKYIWRHSHGIGDYGAILFICGVGCQSLVLLVASIFVRNVRDGEIWLI